MALANGGGAGLINMLVDACEEKGIELMLNTKGTSLITDDTGAVVGAVAETADSIITFHAKSVILATGGISQNQELVEKYSPKLTRAGLIPTSAVSHTGDGFLMALEVGAGTFDVFATPLFSTVVDPELSALTDTSVLTIYGQLGVNANGDRFGNEAASAGWDTMDHTASDMIQDGNAPFWYIYDSSNADAVAALEAGVESGVVAKADTIEGLALGMHVYTDRLVAAYEDYSAAVAAGKDEAFGKDASFLLPIEKAPFYAVSITPTLVATTGGAKRDTDGRVLDWNENPIPGLYEAGELGSYVSNLYQNGVFLSEAMLSGRTAAQTAFGGESEVKEVVKEEKTGPAWADAADGEYTAVVDGLHDKIEVKMTVEGGKLTAITIGEGRSEMIITDEQLAEYVNAVIDSQSTDVDVIAGATIDCQAIATALIQAFAK